MKVFPLSSLSYRAILLIFAYLVVGGCTSSAQTSLAVNADEASSQKQTEKAPQNSSDTISVNTDSEIVVTFKTQLVVVPFSVIDRANRPITDLTMADVKLYENNQPVSVVSLQRSGTQPLNVALLLDLSGSMLPHLSEAQTSANRFFDQALKPQDKAAVVAFQQEIVLAQPLTADRVSLKESLKKRFLALSTAQALDGNNRHFTGTSLYGAIYVAVDEVLQTVNGRRVIILISDGYDSESGMELRDALDYAWRREVTIYTIGLGEKEGLNQTVLEHLCTATGGRAFYPKTVKDLDTIFQQIDDDLRQQYILTFYPSTQALDTFRTIKIDIPQRPALNISYRFGYYNAITDENQ